MGSALSGTYTDIEVIVVDDGSSDSSAAVAREIAESDNRVQVHSRPRGGVSAALNFGLEQALGDYVARLDSDDIWHPTKLDKQMKVAAADPAVALVYTLVRYIDGEGRVTRDVAPQLLPRHALCRCLYEDIIGGNSSVLMRRSAIEEAGGYDETLISWEDLLLFLAITARHEIAFVPEYLVGYRVRPGSLSANRQGILVSWSQARRRIKQRFRQVPPFVRRWAHGRRMVELAEGFAWGGSYLTCARLLLEGFVHDPTRTSVFLGYRLHRLLGRRRDQSDEIEAPTFLECDPREQYKVTAFDLQLEGKRLHRFETARRRTLDRLDAQIATNS